MTIPGKGGRPRKWRSDADRVRAFRARQRGEAEPQMLAEALDESDELAAAWEQVRQLGQQFEELRALERAARREAAAARRDLSAQEDRFTWLSADNQDLRTRLENVEQDRSTLADELAATRQANATLRRELNELLAAHTSAAAPEPGSVNRAERCRAARDARRRS